MITRVSGRPTLLGALSVLLASSWGERIQGQESGPSAQTEFFEKKIRPVLDERCYSCHSARAEKVKGGLLLDSRSGWARGGESGRALEPGDPEQGTLIRAIRYTDPDLQMPPKAKDRLTRQQVSDFESWVRMGAPDPRASSDALSSRTSSINWEQARKFWAFRPVQNPPVPTVRDQAWPATGIDRFILSRLEEKGIRPGSDADKRTLLRRATFDLTGLPPTPEEIECFLKDDSPEAYPRLIERLLSSPRYGERWGRHWLDVARYADTAGDSADYPIPQAYRYRNYVIDAFNKDKPYDRFLREQIAGDLLDVPTEAERYEASIATGFLALARRSGEDPDKEHHITIDDAIDTLGKTILGMSLSCARCHDHKFDPIPKEDYYAIYGILASSRFAYAGSDHKKYQRDIVPLITREEAECIAIPFDEKLASLEASLAPLIKEAVDFEKALGGVDNEGAAKAQKRTLKELKAAIEAAKKECDKFGRTRPDYPAAYGISEGVPTNARIQIAGNPSKLGAEVPRGFLQVLGGQRVPPGEKGSGRRLLADWLADAENPLTARVMANRIWQYHFGRGLVQTPDVYGKQGKPPTHPELLDYLARRFVEGGWSIKALHRLIMLSRTYRLSSREDSEAARQDPANALWWRFDRRRLEAEAIRDSLLAVSGELDTSAVGPHPFPAPKDWNFSEASPFRAHYETKRRSVYLLQPRVTREPFLALFDGPDANLSVGKRFESTTSVQALYLMNSAFMRDRARALARRVMEAGAEDPSRIRLAHLLAFGRPASPEETAEGLSYLEKMSPRVHGAAEAWTSYLRALLSANEFIYVD